MSESNKCDETNQEGWIMNKESHKNYGEKKNSTLLKYNSLGPNLDFAILEYTYDSI